MGTVFRFRFWKVKMASKPYTQDLPPKGGFDPIKWARKAPRKTITAYKLWGGWLALNLFGWPYYIYKEHVIKNWWREEDDARIAVEPFLYAEKDRAYLAHLRKCREEENELMKDVDGWVTGTLWGSPVYHNPRGRFIYPKVEELFVHNTRKQYKEFWNDGFWMV